MSFFDHALPAQHQDFDAVLFDMDGLLLDTERLVRDVWRTVAARNGYVLDDAGYMRAIGTTRADTIGILQTLLGPHAPVEVMAIEKQRAVDAAIDGGQLRAKPGIAALLNALRAQRLVHAVATSTARALALKKLALVGHAQDFPLLVGGDQVARGKPAPDLFLRGAELIDVAPARCLVLEDSLNGLRAASAAGMRVIMVPDLVEPDDEARSLAWQILPSLDAVRTALFGA
jgi:HAD superfamily hydrolase (TIGR01509 family)